MTVSELSGRWTFMVTTPLTEGTYNFRVVATDLAGNASVASTPREITIDLTAPAKPALLALAPASDSGKSHTDNLTNNAPPTITQIGRELRRTRGGQHSKNK